jgi:DNA primase
MKIGRETIVAVQERADIEEVVSDYVALKKKGQNLWACCPFHNEKTPSFSVAPNKGIYKCFGCGKAGDSIQFVMDVEGIGFNEAVKQLAGKYGIEIAEKEFTDAEEEAYNEKESLYILMNHASEFYRTNLHQTDEGKSIGLTYFKERGLTDEIIDKFELGYSMDSWDALRQHALKLQYTDEQLEKAGLLIRNEQKTYDRFRGRVMFPIHNVSGRTIAFGARMLGNQKDQPKYINSPETDIYHKSDVLYGVNQAKKAIRQTDNCYLVEGYLDVISMHMMGVENVVAASGTSLTENQIRLIGRFTQNITVLFDGDAAGLKAALRGIDMILESNLNVKVLSFPEGDDPDSYARKCSPQEYRDYLATAVDFIVFKTRFLIDASGLDPLAKAETIKDIVHSISKIPDAVKRTVYVKECSKLLDIDESVLIGELNKQVLKQRKSPKREEIAPEGSSVDLVESLMGQQDLQRIDSLDLQERESIRLLLNYGNETVSQDHLMVEYLMSELEGVSFVNPIYSRIWNEIKLGFQEGAWYGMDYFMRLNDVEVRKLVIELCTERYELSKNWEIKHQIFTTHEREILNDSAFTHILRLKHRAILRLIDHYKEELKEADDEKLDELLVKIQELNEAKKMLGKELGMVVVK